MNLIINYFQSMLCRKASNSWVYAANRLYGSSLVIRLSSFVSRHSSLVIRLSSFVTSSAINLHRDTTDKGLSPKRAK